MNDIDVILKLGNHEERLHLIQHTDYTIRVEGGYYDSAKGCYVFEGFKVSQGTAIEALPNSEVPILQVFGRNNDVLGRVVLVPKRPKGDK